MRRSPMTLHRPCQHAVCRAALCLTLMATAPMAQAAPGIGLLAPGAAQVTPAVQPLRPRDVTKTPPLPMRRPIEDSASLALLLSGLVALWRAAERRAGKSHATFTQPHRPTQKESHS